VAKSSILAVLKPVFDACPGRGRQRLTWRVVVVTLFCRRAQEFYLFPIARTPDTQRQMDPETDALQAGQRVIQRLRLKADGFFAIGRIILASLFILID